jgi:hypothetical protein
MNRLETSVSLCRLEEPSCIPRRRSNRPSLILRQRMRLALARTPSSIELALKVGSAQQRKNGAEPINVRVVAPLACRRSRRIPLTAKAIGRRDRSRVSGRELVSLTPTFNPFSLAVEKKPDIQRNFQKRVYRGENQPAERQKFPSMSPPSQKNSC